MKFLGVSQKQQEQQDKMAENRMAGVKCGVCRVQREVWSLKCEVWSVKWKVWRAVDWAGGTLRKVSSAK